MRNEIQYLHQKSVGEWSAEGVCVAGFVEGIEGISGLMGNLQVPPRAPKSEIR